MLAVAFATLGKGAVVDIIFLMAEETVLTRTGQTLVPFMALAALECVVHAG